MELEDRWFVRFRGQTLGPLTTEQVKISLRNGELGASDKVASSKDPSWNLIDGHPVFGAYEESLRGARLELRPIPTPDAFRRKRAPVAMPTITPEPTPASAAPATPAPSDLFPFQSRDDRPPDPASMAREEATTEAPRKPKRVAGPGKKLGRPRKYPRPEETTLTDLVAPILAQVPGTAPSAPEAVPATTPDIVTAPEPAATAPEPATIATPVEESAPQESTSVQAATPVSAEKRGEASLDPAGLRPAFQQTPPSAPLPEVPVHLATAEENRLAAESLLLLQSLRDYLRQEQGRPIAEKRGEAVSAEKRGGAVSAEKRGGAVSAEKRGGASLDPAGLRPAFQQTGDPAGLRPAFQQTPASARARFQQKLWIAAIFAALVLLSALGGYVAYEKTRGPESFTFPDPSNPTVKPASPSDPNSALRAPTRPQRD